MSLGISFESKGSLFQNVKQNELQSALEKLSQSMDFSFQVGSNKYYNIQFCPDGFFCIEYIKGKFKGDINTSVVGPGFHHACIVLLEELEKELSIKITVSDETDYYRHRNFPRLVEEMLGWLKQIAALITNSEYESQLICWDISGYRPESTDLAATPRGFMNANMVASYIENDRLRQFGDLFWIWTNKMKDAYYHRGCALSIMWKDVIWRKPETEEECRVIQNAIQCLNHASELDQNIALPKKEWRELCILANEPYIELYNPDLEFPTAIGYRRNMLVYPYPCNFSVRLPGSFLVEIDDDGVPNYYDGNKAFHMTVFRLKDKKRDFREEIHSCEEGKLFNKKEWDFISNDCRYFAEYGKVLDGEEKHFTLYGQVGCEDKLALITISWLDEQDENWAIEAFKAVHYERDEAKV